MMESYLEVERRPKPETKAEMQALLEENRPFVLEGFFETVPLVQDWNIDKLLQVSRDTKFSVTVSDREKHVPGAGDMQEETLVELLENMETHGVDGQIRHYLAGANILSRVDELQVTKEFAIELDFVIIIRISWTIVLLLHSSSITSRVWVFGWDWTSNARFSILIAQTI
jgi:hypothetical protein